MEHRNSLEVWAEKWLEELMLRHADNPAIHTLLQLLPGFGGAADTVLTFSITRLRKERLQAYFEEIASRMDRDTAVRLAEELPGNEDLIHVYFITTRAALDTRRRAKIRLFARLFANYVKGESVATGDAYEEMLAVLDDLSYREFQVLLILHRFETETPLEEQPDTAPVVTKLHRATRFWDDFVQAVESEAGIPSNAIPGALERLTRTGLYQTNRALVAGYPGEKGNLTPNFATFLKALGSAGEV
jgi:hypothetical protein